MKRLISLCAINLILHSLRRRGLLVIVIDSKGSQHICYNCNLPGHTARYCKAGKGNSSNTPTQESNHDKEDKSDTNQNKGKKSAFCTDCGSDFESNGWVLDSGASFHMTSRKEFLSNYVEVSDEQITLGDNSVLKIIG